MYHFARHWPTIRDKLRKGLVASRPITYVIIVCASVLGAFAYKLRFESIFSCRADGYSSDQYLAYCHGSNYGDYEHGAFWFGLEPSAQKFATNAEVLFLGDSRLQAAFSTNTTANWFASPSTQYYLLGFSYGENVAFTEKLLNKLKPRAKVYIITVDFFERSETPPARTVMRDSAALTRYEEKRRWQFIHEPFCKMFSAACRDLYVVFRSRETGAFDIRGSGFKSSPLSYDHLVNQDLMKRYTESAIDFLSRRPIKQECVILTTIPTVKTNVGTANSIATVLSLNFIAPEIEDLQTFDGSHLDRPSAERWSSAFFQAAGPQIKKCLGKSLIAG
jgi:hypothetical protein